jgi:hypothetical protein
MHRAIGCAHATIHHHLCRTRRALIDRDEGQGTVEYIGLILLIAGIMAAVVALKTRSGTDLGGVIVGKLKDSVDGVGDPPSTR